MSETAAPLAPGTIARATRWTDGGLSKGERFTIDDFVSAEESEDGVAFYNGSARGGFGNVWIEADSVDVEMTADEARARKVPSLKEVRRFVAGLCGETGETFDIDESDYSGTGNRVSLYGETDDGLRFAITLAVESIEEAD